MAGPEGQQESEVVAVEHEPKQVLGDSPSDDPLLTAPRSETLDRETAQRDQHEPEVVLQVDRHSGRQITLFAGRAADGGRGQARKKVAFARFPGMLRRTVD